MEVTVSCGVFLIIFATLYIMTWISALRRNTAFKKAIKCINEKNCEDAIPYLNKALSIWPDPDWLSPNWKKQRAIIHSFRGYCYMKQEEYALSQADYNKAIEIEPLSILGHMYRGENLYKLGRLEEALQDLNLSVHLLLNDSTPKLEKSVIKTLGNIMPIMLRAAVHGKMGNLDLADKDHWLCKQIVPDLKIRHVGE